MVIGGEHARDADGQQAERRRDPERQRRSGHGHWRDQQKGEWVLQSARQIEQGAKLENVVGQHQKGVDALQTLARRIADAERHVEPGRERDHDETGRDRQIDAQHPIGADHGDGLAEHGEPAQADDGLQAQTALAPFQPDRGRVARV